MIPLVNIRNLINNCTNVLHMRIHKTCPICNSSELKIKKSHIFQSPFNDSDFDEITNTNYKKNRLAILFGHMIESEGKSELKINITQCKSCSFIFFNPRFTTEEIINKYSRISELEKGKQQKKKTLDEQKKSRAKRIYKLVSSYSDSNSRSVLDYGGAQGFNLYQFLNAGNNCSLLDYVKYDLIGGIKYLGKDQHDLNENQKFDIILFCHTLEHVIDVKSTINELTDLLNKNGLLYIEVPLGCWREWDLLPEPITHVNFFSEESIYKLMQALDLRVVHLSTDVQWVAESNNHCINLIVQKSSEPGVSKYKRAQQQESNIFFYAERFFYNKERVFKKLFKL